MKHYIKYAFIATCACALLCTPLKTDVLAAGTDAAASEAATAASTDTSAAVADADDATANATGTADDAATTATTDDGIAATSEQAISLSDCTISLSKTTYTYSGKEKKPSISVYYGDKKLKKNKNYTIRYDNNIQIGTASVTITGMGGYQGTITKTYTIFPKTPVAVSATVNARKIVATWSKSKTVDGYILYRRVKGARSWQEVKAYPSAQKMKYTDTDCTYGVTYEYAVRSYKDTADGRLLSDYSKTSKCAFKPQAPVITQLMPVSDSAFSIKWDLVKDADGYIIYKNVDGKWKKVKTIAAYATNHYTVKGLTYKNTYRFAVRAYWLSDDGTIQKGSLSEAYKEKLYYKAKYEGNYKLYYDASGDLITNVEGIIEPQSAYTIQINRTTDTVTVYAADTAKKGCLIPVKAFLCSTGTATPAGTFRTTDKYRWHPLYHNVYGQWCTRITGSILFHSVYYLTNQDANSLDVTEFNKLGTPASAGCIRLNCEDTKWIYDNCSRRTQVTIYDDPNPGPLGTPEALKLDADHTWDPTDPEMKYLCEENGCHQE